MGSEMLFGTKVGSAFAMSELGSMLEDVNEGSNAFLYMIEDISVLGDIGKGIEHVTDVVKEIPSIDDIVALLF